MPTTLVITGLLLIACGLTLFVLGMCSMILMALNRKPGVPWRRPNESPFNIMFRPDELDPTGLKWRNLMVFSLVLAFILWISTLLLFGAFRR